jgi:hypothetical protein
MHSSVHVLSYLPILRQPYGVSRSADLRARPVSSYTGGLARCLMSGLHWKADFSKAATHLVIPGIREPYSPPSTHAGPQFLEKHLGSFRGAFCFNHCRRSPYCCKPHATAFDERRTANGEATNSPGLPVKTVRLGINNSLLQAKPNS